MKSKAHFSRDEKFERGDTDCERNFIEKVSPVREWKFLKVNINKLCLLH